MQPQGFGEIVDSACHGAGQIAGDPARALSLYREALGLARESSMRDEQAIALEGIGNLRSARGERAEGVECLTEALEIFRQLGQDTDVKRIEDSLAELV